jgi:hypothetical protein
MLEAMARIALSQPNEAMARIAPRRNGTISLDPSCRVKIPSKVLWTRLEIVLVGSNRFKNRIGLGISR